MNKFSIVIVVKNASDKISRLLQSVIGLSDDIIVCDTGSTDDTIRIIRRFDVRLFEISWEGYGRSKNAANRFAKYDWILSLDADEKVDPCLFRELKNWRPASNTSIYKLRWKNFFGDQWIRNSDWGRNWKNRLFNKHLVRWDDAIAHENLCSEHDVTFHRLSGWLEHYSFSNESEYKFKMEHSAKITGMKYHQQQKRCSVINILLSPAFTFMKVYLLKLGFLDGPTGWLIAITSARYTFLKYVTLKNLNRKTAQNSADGMIINRQLSSLKQRQFEVGN
jgi:glycosyltransferase involved in cell wall biosynthesis